MIHLVLKKDNKLKGWKMVGLYKNLPPADELTKKYGTYIIEHLETDLL